MKPIWRALFTLEFVLLSAPAILLLFLSPVALLAALGESIPGFIAFTGFVFAGLFGLYSLFMLFANAMDKLPKENFQRWKIATGMVLGVIVCLGLALFYASISGFYLIFVGPILLLLHLMWLNKDDLLGT